ncbi:MFS transporter [Georgenia sp. SYP-B2076]|uniref:MFS transporter n=1 Tax=Georgenia sp. SYP-B2076 TaxID=2495881 RepID=UPI000F8E57B5|nr:MFS transporter [Georgenia sp. SYP-B2076]
MTAPTPDPAPDALLRPGSPAHRRALVALFGTGMATFALLWSAQPLLVLIGEEFALPATSASLLLSVATAALALAVLPLARLSERWGRARVIAGGLTVAVLAGIALAGAGSWPLVLGLRTLQGAALAAVPAAALAWVAEEVAPAAVTQMGGLYIAGTSLGGMGGRLLAGGAAELWGWRGALLAVACLSAVVAVAALALLPPSRHAGGRRPAPPPSRAAPRRDGEPAATPARADPYRAARVRLYAVGGLGMAMFVGMYNVVVYRTSAEPYQLGVGLGSMFFLTYAAGTLTSAQAGRLTARVGVRVAVLVGLATCAAGVLVTLAAPLWAIWLGLLLLAAGFFVTHATANSTVARIAPRPSAAAGRYTFAYYLGSSVGGVLLGQAWDVGAWGGTALAALAVLAIAALVAAGLPHRPGARAPAPQR